MRFQTLFLALRFFFCPAFALKVPGKRRHFSVVEDASLDFLELEPDPRIPILFFLICLATPVSRLGEPGRELGVDRDLRRTGPPGLALLLPPAPLDVAALISAATVAPGMDLDRLRTSLETSTVEPGFWECLLGKFFLETFVIGKSESGHFVFFLGVLS